MLLGAAPVRGSALGVPPRFIDLRLDLRRELVLRCLRPTMPEALVLLEADDDRSGYAVVREDRGLVAITSTTYKFADAVAGL